MDKLNKFLKSFLVTKSRVRSNVIMSYDLYHELDSNVRELQIKNSIAQGIVSQLVGNGVYNIEEKEVETGIEYSTDLLIFNTNHFKEVLEAYVELHPKYKEMKEKAWMYDNLNK